MKRLKSSRLDLSRIIMTTTITPPAPIQDYAIIVDPRDNVAVVKQATAPGLIVALSDGRALVT